MEKEECCANLRRKIMPPYAHAYTTHPINKFTFVDPVWHSVEDDVSNPVSSNWVKAGAAHRRPEKHVKTLVKTCGNIQSYFCITCRICYSCTRRGIRFPSAPSASVPCTAAEGGDWSENSNDRKHNRFPPRLGAKIWMISFCIVPGWLSWSPRALSGCLS